MKLRVLSGVALIALGVSGVACKKKAAVTPPPAPPAQTASAPAEHAAQPAEPARQPEQAAAHSRYPDAKTLATIEQLMSRIEDAYFDYDKHSIRADAEAALKADATTLGDIIRQYPDFRLKIEGHCDERGSREYNLALGDARARAVHEFLATSGVPAAQMTLISYGKDKPFCTEHTESCWQQNRRAHLVAAAAGENTN
jgi:peptidoglycan-associated lipoprotein